MEWLTFRTLTFVSDNVIDLTFDADDGSEVTYRFTASSVRSDAADRDIILFNADEEYASLYNQVPGPATPMWPFQLVSRAFAARAEPLPAGQELERRRRDAREAVQRRWAQAHSPSIDGGS